MNLSSMLRERAAAGRPIRIGQIGAGKFGTMFLSQVRLTAGMHLAGLADLMPARARERMIGVGWPKEQTEAQSMADALKTGTTLVTDDAMAVIAPPRDRRGHRGDRGSRHRHPPVPGRHPPRQARRHGQRRGRRAGGAAAGAAGAGSRRRLLARLGRPARADLRARRLGARLRVQGGRGRQGHALPPDLSPLHPGERVGHPRPVPEDQGPQPYQPQDVQLVRGRHQVRHRDDGGVQRHRPGAAGEWSGLPAGLALRVGTGVQAQEARAAAWRRRA